MNSSLTRLFGDRFTRAYPLHLLTITIVGVMIFAGNSYSISMERPYFLSDSPPQLLLLHAFPHVEKWAWVHPSWSISMKFLAFVAIFPSMTPPFRNRRTLADKSIAILILFGLYGLTYWVCQRNGGNAAMGWHAVGRVVSGFGIDFMLFKGHSKHPDSSIRIQNHHRFDTPDVRDGLHGIVLRSFQLPVVDVVNSILRIGPDIQRGISCNKSTRQPSNGLAGNHLLLG